MSDEPRRPDDYLSFQIGRTHVPLGVDAIGYSTTNGYSTQWLTMRLPVRFAGGDPDTHVFVAAQCGREFRGYVFAGHGGLVPDYLCEVLSLPTGSVGQRQNAARVLWAICDAITVAGGVERAPALSMVDAWITGV